MNVIVDVYLPEGHKEIPSINPEGTELRTHDDNFYDIHEIDMDELEEWQDEDCNSGPLALQILVSINTACFEFKGTGEYSEYGISSCPEEIEITSVETPGLLFRWIDLDWVDNSAAEAFLYKALRQR